VKYTITTLIDKKTLVKYTITTLIDKTTPVKYKITILRNKTTPLKYKITTLIDVGWTSLWLEPMIYCTRGVYNDHYTTDEVNF
jgi:hypothetical protein